ncbi:unnamed protein product [Brassicogethes aeneus]|uniref:Uncharacterized protein n=1 Tax=Brassicogethes aeneus TaxID=1431903 RepID=A0A9P0F9H5_BRAAE|nr:unnamed protein product [Brassicogethes aeneus]
MATTEQFSLRWNNFHSNLTSGFHELLEAADMVDVTLAVDGHVLQAHKIVLSICSPYFKQMFKLNPCKHPIVILRDVGHENMKDILEFMYMGEVSVLRENLSAFLRTAELLQVKGLTGDDSSDTSSRKDERLDCDIEEEEISDFNQMLETELPRHYPPKVSPPTVFPNQTPSLKRHSKSNSNSSIKRSKSEANQNKKPVNHFTTEAQDLIKPKMEFNPELNESINNAVDKSSSEMNELTKDNIKQLPPLWENNIGPSGTDLNTTEQGSTWSNLEKSIKFNNKQTYQCDKCWKKFSRRDHLRTHEKNIHGEDAGPFVCAICSQLYKNTESLRKHIAKFHFPKDNSHVQALQKLEEIKVEN